MVPNQTDANAMIKKQTNKQKQRFSQPVSARQSEQPSSIFLLDVHISSSAKFSLQSVHCRLLESPASLSANVSIITPKIKLSTMTIKIK
ncbi:hypothetical protein T09_2133 [Trichinella sp. T9]|nr:hypothetical protein T09_2133 [Trichinella sp. T9]